MLNIIFKKRRLFFLACITSLLGCVYEASAAQESQTPLLSSRVAAVVNDQIVTQTDVDQRLRLLNFLMDKRAQDIPPPQMISMVLKTLVDEKLKMSLARKFKIQISDEDIRAGLERFISTTQPHLNHAQFVELLKGRKIGLSTVEHQIKAQIGWQRAIQAYYHDHALVTEREIDQELAYLHKERQGTQYDLMEIVLRVDSPQQEPKVLEQAHQLMTQLKKGERFELLAQQFSQSSTAATGGQKGWVHDNLLDPAVRAALTRMSLGTLEGPIRTKEAVFILFLKNRKEGGKIETLTFLQGVMGVQVTSEVEALNVQLQVQEAMKDIHSCPAFEAAFKKRLGGVVSKADRVESASLPPSLQNLLSKTSLNVPTEGLWVEGGVAVFMLCERHSRKEAEPSRDQVSQDLYLEKINLLAQRMMRDLHHQSLIEIKI